MTSKGPMFCHNQNRYLLFLGLASTSASLYPSALPFQALEKQGPIIHLENIDEPAENKSAFAKGQKFYLICVVCQKGSANWKQTVSAFGGFVSATGNCTTQMHY